MKILRIRGILDEIHVGEVDPGMFRIYDAGGALVGFFWRYDNATGQEPHLILFKNYASQVPGPPLGTPGVPDPEAYPTTSTTLTFQWAPIRITLDEAKNEWQALNPTSALEYVVTEHPRDQNRIIEHNP